MLADNSFMLEQFRTADEIRYFYNCIDITLAGEDYKVNDIKYFISSTDAPLDNFVSIKLYYDNSLLIHVYTKNEELICEVIDYISASFGNVDRKELVTPYEEVLTYKCLSDKFNFVESDEPGMPYYGIYSKDELAELKIPEEVSVAPMTDEDKKEVEQAPDEQAEGITTEIFRTIDCYKTRFYIIRVNGKIAGYLRGECGYSNIYDIGWIAVSPEYRGKGYAVCLALYFSYDCYNRGERPHYGFAVSPESARVAEKCGYKNNRGPVKWMIMTDKTAAS